MKKQPGIISRNIRTRKAELLLTKLETKQSPQYINIEDNRGNISRHPCHFLIILINTITKQIDISF